MNVYKTKIYILTYCSFHDIIDIDIMIPEVISFHVQDCTEGFTPIFLVEDNLRLLFTELVCKYGLQISHICCT